MAGSSETAPAELLSCSPEVAEKVDDAIIAYMDYLTAEAALSELSEGQLREAMFHVAERGIARTMAFRAAMEARRNRETVDIDSVQDEHTAENKAREAIRNGLFQTIEKEDIFELEQGLRAQLNISALDW